MKRPRGTKCWRKWSCLILYFTAMFRLLLDVTDCVKFSRFNGFAVNQDEPQMAAGRNARQQRQRQHNETIWLLEGELEMFRQLNSRLVGVQLTRTTEWAAQVEALGSRGLWDKEAFLSTDEAPEKREYRPSPLMAVFLAIIRFIMWISRAISRRTTI